jgi:hypothetical protein
MSIKWTMNDTLSGFTKNTPEAKTSAEAEMRANNAHRALQLAAIQFAGPLSEYKARVRRYADTKSISYSSRNDKMDAFRTFCYANAIYAPTTLRYDTGEIDFSPKVLQGQLTAWAKWKNDAYALAKSVLESPAASSASERISAEVTRRLSRGVEVRIPASEIQTALDSPVSVRVK